MKRLMMLCLILAGCNYGCAYNSMTITADNGSTVTCTGTVDKPVRVDSLTNPTLQGNVPLQGGAVNNPSQTVTSPGE